jgi:Bestrophin, RFP-TM, chloride channel
MVHVQALRLHLFNGNVVDDDVDDDDDDCGGDGGEKTNNNNNNTGTSSNVVVDDFQLLERVTLLNMLNDYVHEYRNLLKLASTPIPFPLIQMARTFLFLWTFTIPLVLRGVVSGEALAALVFVFFLTYGFIGLELVATKLMYVCVCSAVRQWQPWCLSCFLTMVSLVFFRYPFGDEVNDLNVSGMREVRSCCN